MPKTKKVLTESARRATEGHREIPVCGQWVSLNRACILRCLSIWVLLEAQQCRAPTRPCRRSAGCPCSGRPVFGRAAFCFVQKRNFLTDTPRDGCGTENPRARILTCQNKSYALPEPSMARFKFQATNLFHTVTRCSRRSP